MRPEAKERAETTGAALRPLERTGPGQTAAGEPRVRKGHRKKAADMKKPEKQAVVSTMESPAAAFVKLGDTRWDPTQQTQLRCPAGPCSTGSACTKRTFQRGRRSPGCGLPSPGDGVMMCWAVCGQIKSSLWDKTASTRGLGKGDALDRRRTGFQKKRRK